MKKILVTGGSGMVGRYLRKLLPNADYPSSAQLNLLNPIQAHDYISSYRPDVVVHLAAKVGGIIDNVNNPVEYFEDNLLLNYMLVKACTYNKVPNLITVLSTCAYPDNLDQTPEFSYPMKESNLHDGPPAKTNYGYGYAKRVLGVHLDLVKQVDDSLNYCYLIPSNMFGEYDKYDETSSHFISALLKKLLVAEQQNSSYITLLGTGFPLRQFMYAKDLARVIALMIQTDTYQNMNVCPSEVKSIRELTQEILKALNLEHIKVEYTGTLDGQYRKDASNKKLLHYFPDFSFTPFDQAVKQTYSYLKNNINQVL